ncbi:MAG: hydantoinase/oxoprolinase family protein [Desulfobacterales bacterium]|nr:hydantoinase/oxoprolinase family protein [Desulfobacterales bacterium]
MIIGLDVGGTHTDVVLLGSEGLVRSVKIPTDTTDLFKTVLEGINRITDGIAPDTIQRLVLSTTLTTNAVVQGKTPTVGMIVTGGPGIDPKFYRPCDQYYVAAGAIDHRGRETAAIDPSQITGIAKQLTAKGIELVGVVGKFSTRNPAHEMAIAKLIEARFQKVFFGHRVSGDLNFPRRIATTYLNTAVYPIHREFFSAVKKSLVQKGLTVPIRILKADGGNMNLDASIDFPAQTILSGPAASVMGCLAFAPDEEECLVMDIGGTTTDMAVMVNNAPLLDPKGTEIRPLKTLVRSLKTLSIGVGGDSAVRVTNGDIKVGPERLGPAMAYGGPGPTPTDAMLVLGIIKGEGRAAAEQGIAGLAGSLGQTIHETAERIFNRTCEKILEQAWQMVDRINSQPVYTVHEMLEGHSVRPEKILVLGGPAAGFAHRLEKLSGLKVGVVPRWEVANAIGAALARTTTEVLLRADTQQGVALAPEEHYHKRIKSSYSMEKARQQTLELLKAKALAMGANPGHLELEIVDEGVFNMVRGFNTTGKIMHVKAQIKPGLIHGYDPIAGSLI